MIKGILYAPEAIEDLRKIEEYISVDLDNKHSAVKIVDKIIDKIDSLSELPEIGSPLSSRINIKTDYRYLVCGSYNVFYRIENGFVQIIRSLNARRNFMLILFGQDE